MSPKSISIVVRFELSRLVRTPAGILFLTFFGIVYGWCFKILYNQADNLRQAQTAIRANLGGGQKLPDNWLLNWLEGPIDLAGNHSLGLVMLFTIVIFFTPPLALLAFFEQTSGEVASKHARFILQRLARVDLYIGKAIAALIAYAIIMAGVIGIGYAVCVAGDIATSAELLYVGRIWLTAVVYSLPFLGMAAFAAAAGGQPIFSILMTYGYIFLVWAVSGVGRLAGPAFKKVGFASPTYYDFSLMKDSVGDIGLALGHQLGLGAFFFLVGLWIFTRRDV